MHKLFLFLFLVGATHISLYAQVPEDEDPDCREKCSFARSMNRGQQLNFFQNPSMDKYDVKYIKLDLTVEVNNRFIEGTALTRSKAVQALDSFIIEFKNTMVVDSVFINGIKKNFTRASDHIQIPLAPVIPVGSMVDALVYYRGTASGNGVFAGTVSSNGLAYTATLSESYQAREWFPAKQILKDKIDSADIWITTSDTNKVGSNGLLKAVVSKPNNKKQFQWSTRYPIAYYLLSFSVGNYMDYSIYAKPPAIAPDSILIQNYIVNNNSFFSSNKLNIDKTAPFLEKMSELFGLYPFKNEKYGHSHAIIGGGMEHQTMTTMSSFGTSVIAHELGHQWFGDNVTCATWNHIWLNEGFASYADYLMVERLPAMVATTPAAYMLGVHNDVLLSLTGSVFVPDASLFDENRIFSSRFSYNKGSAIIHTLRFEMQDDTKFFQTLKTFQQQFKDSVATADDFKSVAESVCGRSFTDFFNQWYYGQGYPTFNVDCSSLGDSIVLSVSHTSSAPTITPVFKGLYEFTITSAQGDTTVKVNLVSNSQQFKFKSSKIPGGVVVDPNNQVLNKTGSITTGTNNLNVTHEVKLFPNPSSGLVHLQYPASWFESISVFDISGRLVQRNPISRSSSAQSVQLSFSPGLYIIQLNGKGRIAVKKIAKVY